LPDAQPLAGRLALVTGASRGIGHATALALAQAGAHVIATARTQGGLEALDDAILKLTGAHATLVPADITDGDGLDRLGGAIFERWGKLDILVSNAGDLGLITPVGHLDPEVWDRAVAVNMTAVYRLIRSMDPLLRAADAGRAIFVTSTAAATPHAFWGPYAATKAGMEMLVKVYADEVEHTKLRCTLVNPGPMRTRMRMAAFPGEDPADLTPPEAIGPLMVELARGDLAPPGMVDYRLWAEGRPSLGDTRVS
jgi:NAD(P)-dependent dehydrogenase (short-subunit alcohol dehydrogenase family)